MNGREETIKGLEEFVRDFKPFCGNQTDWKKVYDAIALLKEQEPVKAVADGEDYRCNNCGTVIGWDAWEPGGVEEVKDKFCPECGRPVKWE